MQTPDTTRNVTTAEPVVRLPWGAWRGDSWHELAVPRECKVELLSPRDAVALSDVEITAAIDKPIESPSIGDLIGNGEKSNPRVCIAVDDLARPTQAARILPVVLDRLAAAGVAAESISIVIATGTHGTLSPQDIAQKVGEQAAATLPIEVHDAATACAPTGIQYGASTLLLNRTFLQADIRISIGCVLPHPFAGFGGGAKMVLPGLSDAASAERSHKFVQMGLRSGNAEIGNNRFRLEIEQLVRDIGLHFSISVVPNSRRETAGLFAGDFVAAHRRACNMAADVFATPLESTKAPYDALICNAYPKDLDLIQSRAALLPVSRHVESLVQPDGVVILATAASEGLGTHGLFDPGGRSYRPPRPLRWLGRRRLWVYSPGASEDNVRTLFPSDYAFCGTSQQFLRQSLEAGFVAPRIGVMPCSPLQLFT